MEEARWSLCGQFTMVAAFRIRTAPIVEDACMEAACDKGETVAQVGALQGPQLACEKGDPGRSEHSCAGDMLPAEGGEEDSGEAGGFLL